MSYVALGCVIVPTVLTYNSPNRQRNPSSGFQDGNFFISILKLNRFFDQNNGLSFALYDF